MVRVAIALLLLMALPAAVWAQAEKRVALVIGNSAYQHAPKLINPRNDAADMAAVLKKHGFQVLEGHDLDKAAFDRKVRDFATALSSAQVGVFFYAGHGLQVSGHNYLVPIDAQLSAASALDFEMVRLDLVHRTMEREAQTNILFLDACRDNPLARNLARAMGTRSTEIGRGLAHVESGVGTLISFSTQPGAVALDGSGRNSPFSGALVKHVSTSNAELSRLLIAVRNDVLIETQRKQVPWEHSALTGPFYFGTPQVMAPPAPAARVSEAERAWRWVKNTTDQSVLENFIKEFGDTTFGEEAKARLAELKKQQVAIATPPSAAGPTAPAKEPLLPGLIDKTLDVVLPRDKPAPAPTSCEGVEVLVGNEHRCLKPKDSFKDCDTCPEMVVVPAGEFIMGSPPDEPERDNNEGPQHMVTIAKPFAVGRFAVTRGEFLAFLGETKHASGDKCWTYENDKWEERAGRSFHNPGFAQADRHPVVCVSWDDAKAFVAWLPKKTSKPYRLLTEAEREYVTRAGTTTPFWWGASISMAQANYVGNKYAGGSKGEYRERTVAVDSFKPNPWGLYNVHGNVFEWVEDCWYENYLGAPTDSSARTTGECKYRLARGGSWNTVPGYLRSAKRYRWTTSTRNYLIGFRLARTLNP